MVKRSPPLVLAGRHCWQPLYDLPKSASTEDYDKVYDKCAWDHRVWRAKREGLFLGAMLGVLAFILVVAVRIGLTNAC